MKIIAGNEISSPAAKALFDKGSSVTVGNFDGVHRGHQEIIARARKKAAQIGVPTVVMTFEPHPRKVLSKPDSVEIITDLRMKSRLLEMFGVDILINVNFTREFAAQPPNEFIDRWLTPLAPKYVVVGYDFNFARGGAGTAEILKEAGKKRGFDVEVVEALYVDGVIASSSRIRSMVEGGEVAAAEKLLGRPYSIYGHVVKGHGRGRNLGFPTANIDSDAQLLPCDGVYAGEVVFKKRNLPAMINVGTNPTFDDIARTVEACILNFDEDLYGVEVEARFRERIRSEKKFSGPQQLINQIKTDQAVIEKFFKTRGGAIEGVS